MAENFKSKVSLSGHIAGLRRLTAARAVICEDLAEQLHCSNAGAMRRGDTELIWHLDALNLPESSECRKCLHWIQTMLYKLDQGHGHLCRDGFFADSVGINHHNPNKLRGWLSSPDETRFTEWAPCYRRLSMKNLTTEWDFQDRARGWDSLPTDLQENILGRLNFEVLDRFKVLSKACRKHVESDAFFQRRGATSSEGLFTAINYYIKNEAWQCTGFDLHSREWRSLPPFSPTLPAPDAEHFKEYSTCGHGGLICADVAKLPHKGELVVFNPLTRHKRALPPLLYPRSPVLVHMSVKTETMSYKVIVAGSSTASEEHLSKKIEVFDSNTSEWKEACDVPALIDEHQAGVCVNGILYVIAHVESYDFCRGVVAFDVENWKWLENMTCKIPLSRCCPRLVDVNGEVTMNPSSLQLVETDGRVYLFCQQGVDGSVEHCIDVLEIQSHYGGAMECQFKNVVKVRKSDARALQVYPEHTCVPFGDKKLCIFNTLTREGVVYDMYDGRQLEVLQPPPGNQQGVNFFTLNPVSFTLRPDFVTSPVPF